jgi:hypothetical protein
LQDKRAHQAHLVWLDACHLLKLLFTARPKWCLACGLTNAVWW